MNTITGKTALVTGSTAGLGKELAIALLRQGAQVMINGRNNEKLMETIHHLRTFGSKVVSAQCDVTKPEDCKKMIRDCIKQCGRLDILINNAGTGSNGLFQDTIPEAASKVIETNLLGSIYPSYYALPYLIESKGSISFISSLAGIHGMPYCYTYSTSKMALTALVQSLRIELSGSGVHTGIMYVGFLKNGPEKRIVGSNGQPVLTTGRPEKFTMTLEKASLHIVKALRKRKSVNVMSSAGKILYQLNRLSPLLVRTLLAQSMTRMKYIYTPEQ